MGELTSNPIPIARTCSALCSVHCNWEHEEINRTMKWPLIPVGNGFDEGHMIECDNCGNVLWRASDSDSLAFNLQTLYEAIFSHRLDGCNGQ